MPTNRSPEAAGERPPGAHPAPKAADGTPRRAPGGPDADTYVRGILAGDRALLGRAITLVESTAPRHEALAQEILQRVLPHTGRARRIGITGVPGVGKSTFIEAFGSFLCGRGLRVAVLAIDPTSTISRGSILGDRTRMVRLTSQPNAFIRPSPSGGALGGVARRTRETMLLCEAAGFHVVVVETVGVGQSEITLRSMVDFFLLLLLPGAGDDLQGMKRGIMEMADAVLINKADGENRPRAEAARAEQAMALHHLTPATPEWHPPVALTSGLTGEGIPELWDIIEKFYSKLEPAGVIENRRREQVLRWIDDLLVEELGSRFNRHPEVRRTRPAFEQAVLRGEMTPVRAVHALMDLFRPMPASGGSDPRPPDGTPHASGASRGSATVTIRHTPDQPSNR